MPGICGPEYLGRFELLLIGQGGEGRTTVDAAAVRFRPREQGSGSGSGSGRTLGSRAKHRTGCGKRGYEWNEKAGEGVYIEFLY
jgi:hypothetical protein